MRNIPMEKLAKTYFDRVAATGAVMTSSRSSRASHQSSLQASMSRNVQESNNSSRWHGINRLGWRNHITHIPEGAAWAGELSPWGLPLGRWMIWIQVFWIGNCYCYQCPWLNTILNPYFHCEKLAESDSVLPSAWEYRPRSHAHDTLISVSVEYLNIPRWWNISLSYYRVSPKKSRLKKNSGTGCPKKLLSQSEIWPDLTLTN